MTTQVGDGWSAGKTYEDFMGRWSRPLEDYWHPFLGGTGPAPTLVSSLSEEQRVALIDELRRRLPIQKGGPIELQAQAWAVVGHRP